MADVQWQELDGAPYTVEAKGRRYQELAAAIQRSVSALDRIETEMSGTSLALDATRALAGDVRADIEKARERYAQTGEALETYGGALRSAKNDLADPAAAALRVLREDLGDAELAQWRAQNEVDDLPADASAADQTAAQTAVRTAKGTASSLRAEVARAEEQWTEGHDAKDRAARLAMEKIDEVVTGAKTHGLKDGFWDKVGDIAATVWETVGPWIKAICDIAGILAIFLSWVPGLGTVLLALAAVGSIIAIIEGVVKMISEGFSWGALFGVAMGVMGLFGGKAIGALAKYSKMRAIKNVRALKGGVEGLQDARKVATVSEIVEASSTTVRKQAIGVLKSPFVRSASDEAIWRMAQRGGTGAEAFSMWRASKFPLPYKDGAQRWMLGNDEVAGMVKFFTEQDVPLAALDGVTTAAQAVASLGAVTHNIAKHAQLAVNLGNHISGGDAWGLAGDVNSLVTSPAGGSYGTLIGGGIKLGKAVFE